ncbi:MAG TPA: cytochrome b/b6 domain-containing protein [Anaerolineales bacterium]|nr:cytochrome b/b6 domain-containing protein [Anaerolineales bacterium]
MSENNQGYLRFSLFRRIEHWVLAATFTILALTGLPQMYAETVAAEAVLGWMGGIESTRVIHRIAAVAMALVAIWHVGYALWLLFVRRERATMMLDKQDAFNAWETLKYNLGKSDDRPKQGYYTFEEKVEYWALIWGTLVMVATGFFLWNPITAARYLPGEWIPAAKAAHGGEALLAVLAIILWHLYHVLVRTFNRSMFTGYLTREQMEHEHPLALEAAPPPAFDEEKLARRKKQFWAGYGLAATLWLVAIVWFVTAEQTANTIIPQPQDLEAFVPLTPTPVFEIETIPGAVARYGETWDGGIGALFAEKCGACHDARTPAAGLDLTSLEAALAGGESGPAVRPGAPGVSLVWIWSGRPGHPGAFSPLEGAAVWSWILGGAPEQ